MRLVAYVRVSSDCQKENTSLDAQRDCIRQYCAAFGYEVVCCFEEVESGSSTTARPELKKALTVLEAGEADGIVCTKLDRFARNALDGLRMFNELRAQGKQLVIIDLRLDTSTPIGQCILTVLLAFAELERNMILDRTVQGLEKVREMGGYVNGNPGYGYKSAPAPDARKCKVKVPVPEEQAWIQRMIEWRNAGWSMQLIVNELTRLGVKSKRGKGWMKVTVKQILQRPEITQQISPEFQLTRTAGGSYTPKAQLHSKIIAACANGWISLDELAKQVGMTPKYLLHSHLRVLLAEGFLEAQLPPSEQRKKRPYAFRSSLLGDS